MLVSSSFDSGNIDVISVESPADIRLKIRADHQSEFLQWFHFRLSGVADTACTLTIENAGDAAYLDGWNNYSVCASYDRETWFRIPTSYNGKELTWHFEPDSDSIYFAYFAPYSMDRHADLIADVAASPIVKTHVLGHTLDGQDMDLVEVGYGPEGRKKIWLCARQHPGETMAEWWMEGALEFLLDEDNPVAKGLLEKAHFYIVPNMNPDGSKRGHLRTNAAGVNLNRVWENPNPATEPEVYLVRKKMLETGVDFHMDVHGDEALPYNFLAGFDGVPSAKEARLDLFYKYRDTLASITPDFQTEKGYPVDVAGTANMGVCTNYMAEAFKCPAMTLEMPFKDNADLPDTLYGWSPERCRNLAIACLNALYQIVDEL
ncbi:M14 family metallopeptidase [Kordiimonas pumila]|uniref:M14-type cytosolic carboxypeptidase n=1 Tax=Kordiimonas pumila TaxID=2161677 RepID=A0ABV7D722_9PROT|nr:M14-type cytosolic carboxypeptidase [Kordiimonas pumila]